MSLCQDIGHRLRIYELSARGVQIYVQGNDLIGSQFQCKLPLKTQLPSEIAATAFRLFRERYHWGSKVRAVTVRTIDLIPQKETDQLSLFIDMAKIARRERLEDMVEEMSEYIVYFEIWPILVVIISLFYFPYYVTAKTEYYNKLM